MKGLDYEDVVLLLEKKWYGLVAVVFLILFCVWVLTRENRYALKIAAISGACVCLLLLLRELNVDYYLIALGSEEDLRAEKAFRVVNSRLSDRELGRLLSGAMKDKNQQFYLALAAAQRDLQIPDAKNIGRPGFFGTNSYTSFAGQIHYPITYGQFVLEYRKFFKTPM